MKMRVAILLVLSALLFVSALPASASRLETSELDASPSTWDGQRVTITGEIIGDYGRRHDVVWVQINDDAYSEAPLVETGELAGTNTGLGVRIPNSIFSESWGSPGGYRTRGPIVEVSGVFRYADDETGGDTFLDATEIQLIEPARPLELPGADWKLIFGSLVAIAAGGALWARARWRLLNPEA